MRDNTTGRGVTRINEAADGDEDAGHHLGDLQEGNVHGAVRDGWMEGGRENEHI